MRIVVKDGKQSGVLHETKPESKMNVIMVSHVYYTATKVSQFSNRNYDLHHSTSTIITVK
jgi:hypothetical protein